MPARFDQCHSELKSDALVIFLFHGVIPRQRHSVRNYTRKHLQEEEFEIALRNLKASGNALSMPEVLHALQEGRPFPSNAYAVTFDDGFENNLTAAAPVLRRHETPATFYVCSSFVDLNRMSWTDQLECAFEHEGAVSIEAPGLGLESPISSPIEKRQALDSIRAYVKNNPKVDPYEYATSILQSMGAPALVRDRWLDQKLSWEQVGALANDPLFEVGGHGHSHRILSYLSDDELDFELDESIAKVARATGRSSDHFSYPEGLEHCYSERVIEQLKKRGIRCSPTAVEGINFPGADPFRLRRIFVV